MSAPNRLSVHVRGYWRCSRRGVWHWVCEHDRSGLMGLPRKVSLSHSGRERARLRPEGAQPVKPKYPPWVEVRYLIRYFGEDGRKYSHYLPRAVGEAWRKKRG